MLELKVKDCEKWVLPIQNLDIFMIWAVKEERLLTEDKGKFQGRSFKI